MTDTVLMVLPNTFGFDEETAKTNTFQEPIFDRKVVQTAREEVLGLSRTLEGAGVRVLLYEDTDRDPLPNAVFPNNWLITTNDGYCLCPMATPSRRRERKESILAFLKKSHSMGAETDLSKLEVKGQFLEGTGSLVLDRKNRVAYAAVSARTSVDAAKEWCNLMDYRLQSFVADGPGGLPVYHTNILLTISESLVVVALELLDCKEDGRVALKELEQTGREIIDISTQQMTRFAGNVLGLRSITGEELIAMSKTAEQAFTPEQMDRIKHHARVVSADINTVETVGGGSVRCTLCEIFSPRIS
ncbi:MAG: hypothetical protein KIT11_02990 [Fimbriimonadaceae bacterium]|nr:hypothetical protein [Fimbriimonadaceae bacterium]QYK57137.1 MAG: hypothetical protein KF733_06535 [Fimbriimonadaceae bacterium]